MTSLRKNLSTNVEDCAAEVQVPKQSSMRALPMSIFKNTLDIPFDWPGKKYGMGMKPWMQ